MTRFLIAIVLLAALAAAYFWAALHWSFSSGERAGWLQKLSNKGWVCKTWEGELAMVSMPGAAPEKFLFTIVDDDVAAQVTKVMGRRATLHYEEKVGLPTSCFGDTRHFVSKVTLAEEISLMPGVAVPTPMPMPTPPATLPPTPPAASAPK